jgi:hypothetical protein
MENTNICKIVLSNAHLEKLEFRCKRLITLHQLLNLQDPSLQEGKKPTNINKKYPSP